MKYFVSFGAMVCSMSLLVVDKLFVDVGENRVISGVSFAVNPGEIILLFGPNASGKTSLAMAILGHPKYRITGGRILFYGRDITSLSMESRIKLGITATFQFAPEIKGITLRELTEALSKRFAISSERVEELSRLLELEELMDRDINVGFSGGERKRAEIFLTALQSPKFVIFDEPDSGVDPDSIALIGKAIMKMKEYGLKGALIITHTGFLSRHIKASRALVMINHEIVCKGPADILASHILNYGFEMCLSRYGDRCELEGKV